MHALGHKKVIVLLFVILAVAYGNSLFNGFVMDDDILIVRNTFYRSLKNLPRLFEKSYFTHGDDAYLTFKEDMGSGSVAYRPVLSATYFLDYQLWGQTPFGYHLTNFWLHFLNTVLVYFVIFRIFRKESIGFLSAVLFSVHPIQAEAVCNIGFRADLLAFCFLLISFLCYLIYSEEGHPSRTDLLAVSFLSYFLSLFSKESAIALPVLIIAYDFYFKRREGEPHSGSLLRPRYLGFLLVTAFYLFIYFFIFPNETIEDPTLFGGNLLTHGLTILRIFASYAVALMLPHIIVPLPSGYAPSVFPLWGYKNILCGLLFVGFLVSIVKTYRKEKAISFFLLWFFIAFIPVSNIIPIVNPIAYRFMYLPSLGFIVVLSVLIERACSQMKMFEGREDLGKVLRIGVVGFYLVLTISLNGIWSSNFRRAFFMVKKYPDNARAYNTLGIEYAKRKLYEQAIVYFKKSVELDPTMPAYRRNLGVSYVGNPDKTLEELNKALALRPDYQIAQADVCRVYGNRGDFKKALLCFEDAIEKGDATIATTVDYIRVCRFAGDKERAERILNDALKRHPGEEEFLKLRKTR